MEEAEALCQRVAIIDNGRVLACDTVEGLKTAAGADTVVTVTYDGTAPDGLDELGARPGISKVDIADGQVRVFTRATDGLLGELVTAGSAAGVTVIDASQLRPSLETVFLTLTGREYRE